MYALGERFDMTFTDRYTPFSPEQQLDAHMVIKNIPAGEYTVTETLLNRHSGSAFDMWVSMGATDDLSTSELCTLAARSTPAVNKYKVSSKGHTIELDALLDMLEVRLLAIKPV